MAQMEKGAACLGGRCGRMNDYISREAARPDAFCDGVSCQECPFLKNSVTGGCRVDDFIKAIPAADVRPVRPCDGCPFCVCEKHGVICPSDPGFRCDTRGGVTDE